MSSTPASHPSPSPRAARRLLSTLGSVTAATTLALGLAAATGPAEARHAQPRHAQPRHAQPPGPVHAGSEYGWGKPKANYKFVGRLEKSQWRTHGSGNVRNQHGMLTLNTADHGTLTAKQVTKGHDVGRWEIRLRSRQYGRGHHDFTVKTELVPAGGRKQYCGAKNVALETYAPHHHRATHYVRSRPDHRYFTHKRIGLHDDQWHTFAVEVTHKRISWFVDAHVISSEKRKDALTGVPFAVKFTMQGVGHARMNRSRMQMDWLRYWTLQRPDTKSTRAPSLESGTFRNHCA